MLFLCLVLPLGALAPMLHGIGWSVASGVVTALILLGAALLRLRGVSPLRSLVVVAVVAAVLAAGLGMMWSTSVGVPLRALPGALADSAVDSIVAQSYPVTVGPGLTALLMGSAITLALLGDLIVFTARMAAATALLQISVFLPGAIITGQSPWPAVLSSAAVYVLLLASDRLAETPPLIRTPGAVLSRVGVPVLATVAVVAVAAGVATMTPGSRGAVPLAGSGQGVAVSPLIALGQDLRRGSEVALLEMQSSADTLPYLRTAVLDEATDDGWREGTGGRRVPAGSAVQNAIPGLGEGIESRTVLTTIRTTGLRGEALP
ncbi:MAG: DUF3488 domain-containing protein, partial [Mycetocola sp.]